MVHCSGGGSKIRVRNPLEKKKEGYMMMKVLDFTRETVDEAVELFVHSFNTQREKLSLIPDRKNLYDELSSAFSRVVTRPGVAAFDDGDLVGYMIDTGAVEDFMGKRTAFSLDLYSHCSVESQKERIYQKMYQQLAEKWVKDGYHTHIFSLWAQDSALSFTFFRLGFGMTHFELLRDLSLPAGGNAAVSVVTLDSMESLKDLYTEEPQYYREAPLFWLLERDEDVTDAQEGVIMAAFDGDELAAYFYVKKNDAETWLMTDGETGRIARAYAKKKYRNRGVGTALLRKTVEWARETELNRLYVEGESANIQGGNFWIKHFTPVVYTVRRCVDERV
jgi:GNAT superfamily N-acetyltransferase